MLSYILYIIYVAPRIYNIVMNTPANLLLKLTIYAWYITGVAKLQLFEGLFVALDMNEPEFLFCAIKF